MTLSDETSGGHPEKHPEKYNDENDEKEYVKIAVLENPFEAQVMGGILFDEGLPFQIRSYHDTAYDGLYQMQKGWGIIRAPQEVKAQILSVLEEIRSNPPENFDFSSLKGEEDEADSD